MHYIKPCTNLPDIFCDKIGWEACFHFFFVSEWIMHLRIWHRSRIHPNIEHFLNSCHWFSCCWWGEFDFINVWAVQIECLCSVRKCKICSYKIFDFPFIGRYFFLERFVWFVQENFFHQNKWVAVRTNHDCFSSIFFDNFFKAFANACLSLWKRFVAGDRVVPFEIRTLKFCILPAWFL